MYPVFSPMQAFVFWLDFVMLPWKMMMGPAADSLTDAAAAANPASVAGLDPVSSQEIGTSATAFSTEPGETALASHEVAKKEYKKIGKSRKKAPRRLGR